MAPRNDFLWLAGYVYRDRIGTEYLLEGEERGTLHFVYLSGDGPIACAREFSGFCTNTGDSDGDILPSFKLREFGTTPDDRDYMKRWGYAG